MLPKINHDNKWAKMPMMMKRLNGFFCYAIMAFVSLWNPIVADMAMYKTLKNQFLD